MAQGTTNRDAVEVSPPAARTGRPVAAVAAGATVLAAWVLSLPRMVPGTVGDHGTFASVAERLLAGDRLYVDVWDNKDPLFYWVLALGRLVSPLSDILVEVLWVLAAAVATSLLARSVGASRLLASVAGFAGVPLVVTGPAYEPGMTHLPGVALTLVAVAVATRRRWVAAGLLVALVGFTKAILAPVAVVALVVVAVHQRAWAGLARAALATVLTAAAGVLALQLRGELSGWVGTYASNVVYAEGELSSSRYGPVVGHLLRAFPEDGRGGGVVTVTVLVGILVLVGRSRRPGPAPQDRRDDPRQPSPALLWDLVVATLVADVGVIALTATWAHHAQALAIPSSIALALLAVRLSSPVGSPAPWLAVLLVPLTAYAAGGALHPYFWLESARGVGNRATELTTVSPESTLLRRLPQVRTYARAGTNDVRAHAYGLRDLRLVCPRFHQYSLDTRAQLEATLVCLPGADALIIDDHLDPEPGQTAWNAYVAAVHTLVASGYECFDAPQARVCLKADGTAAAG